MVRANTSDSHFSLCEGKPIPACPSLNTKTAQLPFIPIYATVLLFSSEVTLYNISTSCSSPTQKPVLKYFFTAQLCSEKWNTVAFPGLVFHVQKDFACVFVLEQHPNDSCIHTEGWVFKKQNKTFYQSLIQTKRTWESMLVLDINCCQAAGRQDTGLYRTLERLARCFSFPYLHIFYHLLYKEGCKCKHRIHLCWDKMHAHRSLIQQRIHQHLQKTKQNKTNTQTPSL